MSERYGEFNYNDSPWYYHPIYRKYWEQYDQLRDFFRNVVSNPSFCEEGSFFEKRHVRAQHQIPIFFPKFPENMRANRFLPFGGSIPYCGSSKSCQDCKTCHNLVADRRYGKRKKHSHHIHKTGCFTNNHLNNNKSTRKHRSENKKGILAHMIEFHAGGDDVLLGPTIPRARSEMKREHNEVRVLPTADESGLTTYSDEANTKLWTSENNHCKKSKHQNFISKLPENKQAKCSFSYVDSISCISSKSNVDYRGRHDLEITNKKRKKGKKHSNEIHEIDHFTNIHFNNKKLPKKNNSENENKMPSKFNSSSRPCIFIKGNAAKREPAKIPSYDELGGWTTNSDTDEENIDSLTSESNRLKMSELQVLGSASSVNYENTYEFDKKDRKNKKEKLHSHRHKSIDYANNPLSNRSLQNNYSRNSSYHAAYNKNTDSVDEDFCAFIRETKRHQKERDAAKSVVNYETYEKPFLTEELNLESHRELYGDNAPAIMAMEMAQYATFKHVVDKGKHILWPYLPMNP